MRETYLRRCGKCFVFHFFFFYKNVGCLHVQGEVKMEAAALSEMLISYRNITRLRNPEYLDLNVLQQEKSRIIMEVYKQKSFIFMVQNSSCKR